MPIRIGHRRARLTLAIAAVVSSWLSGFPARAQDAATGVLDGQVTDPSGAALVGARVVATRSATGADRETTTDSGGRFVLPSLAPGRYRVAVEAAGFASTRIDPVVVEVGRRTRVDAVLQVGRLAESVTVEERAVPVATGSSLVGGVVSSGAVESLPLNGRNFLELALLLPGNAPAPNFDPTKANSTALSSAGQLGRGGNVTIDGQDNNDDVVGGPLANLPQDAVQEFQMATNRFSAEQGRSAAGAVNVVTRSGADTLSGSATVLVRDDSLQGLPATYDRSSGPAPPFSRQQYSAAVGGPIVRGRAWWFAAAEYRNQDAVVQVGERDTATRTIRRGLAEAPLDDVLATSRVDVRASAADTLSLRYVFQDQDDVGASTLDRAIGSASQRQDSRNRHHQGLLTWTRTLSPAAVNTLRASYSGYRNAIDPVSPGRQLTFPTLQDGASFRVPQATTQSRWQVGESLAWVKGAHTLRFGGEASRTDGRFDLGVFRDGRVEMVQDFPPFDLNRDGKVDDEDLLFAVTLRSGKPDQDLVLDGCDSTYLAAFVQDDWRVTPQLTLNVGLRWEMDTDVKNISGYSDINPIVTPFLQGDRKRDGDNFGPRLGFAWTNRAGSLQVHGGWGLYYDRVTLEVMSLERGLDGRALPIEVRTGNVYYLDPSTGTVPPSAPTFSNPFTGFILPGAGASGINIIDNTLENPTVQQMSLGTRFRVPGDAVLELDYVHNRGTSSSGGRSARCTTRWSAGPTGW
jgi:outer membrane receptor protein involved in Fe transport